VSVRLRPPTHRRFAGALAVSFALSSPLVGCGSEVAPPSPAQLQVTDGDRQLARVGTVLPAPVVVTVVDAGGTPLAGEHVEWTGVGDDQLLPVDAATDRQGRARARWQLGSSTGERHAEARVGDAGPAVFTAIAESETAMLFDQPLPLVFHTYDGSGQVVHPDYAATPPGAFAAPLHLAITPYPFGNAQYENPSYFEGGHPAEWSTAGRAPIVLPGAGYLSDPDLVYVPEPNELWLYYRSVVDDNRIMLVQSGDGQQWSTPVQVARAPNHQLVSPSVVRRAADDWWMYAVNGGPLGCNAPTTQVELRRSADGIHWGDPVPVALAAAGLWPWHIDVQWIPSRQVFWAVFNAKTDAGCATPAAFLAESGDGLAWDVLQRPVLTKGRIPALQDIVYRTTFAYDPATDAITFWYSGARYQSPHYVWGAAVERQTRAEVFTPVQALEAGLLTPPPAPLREWP
jgi:hypothetical protein